MKANRIELLAHDVYNAVFAMLDSEPDMTTDSASKVAKAVADTMRAKLGCVHRFESNPGMFDTSERFCAHCGLAESAFTPQAFKSERFRRKSRPSEADQDRPYLGHG